MTDKTQLDRIEAKLSKIETKLNILFEALKASKIIKEPKEPGVRYFPDDAAKYAGCKVKDIIKSNPSYIVWIVDNILENPAKSQNTKDRWSFIRPEDKRAANDNISEKNALTGGKYDKVSATNKAAAFNPRHRPVVQEADDFPEDDIPF